MILYIQYSKTSAVRHRPLSISILNISCEAMKPIVTKFHIYSINRQGEPIILFNPIAPELKIAIDCVLMGKLKNSRHLLPFPYRYFDRPFQKCSMRSPLQSISFLCKLLNLIGCRGNDNA